MKAQIGRSRQATALIGMLETSPGSGVFAADERLRVSDVSMRSDADISTARFDVQLDNGFDTAAARSRYRPDLRVAVRLNRAEGDVLFEGYPPIQEAQWHGGPGRADESFGFTATHVYERLSRDRSSWIYGRQMRNAAIEDGLSSQPSDHASASVHVAALPCVFNLDGRPNRAATPLTVTTRDGATVSVPIFTHDDDPSAVSWTHGDALRYLVWFHALPSGPVGIGNVFADPDASPRLASRLAETCDALNCEATNLVEAFSLLAADAEIHVTVDTSGAGDVVQSAFRIWAAGDGTTRSLHLVRGGTHTDGVPRFDTSGLTASDVFRANEVAEAVIRWDDARIVNAPIVLGDVKRYEMTVPLVPGWLPTADLDNVLPANRTSAKALALTPSQAAVLGEKASLSAWFANYHADGAAFADNRFVARRWVLNEDGRFDGATYNRNAPFENYQPFDFATVADNEVVRAGQWTRRLRPFEPTITETADGARFGVLVELSFDSGVSWHRAGGNVRILRDPTGILLDVDNPTGVTPPGVDPAEQNLWFAIIDQVMRVRVTAVFAGDDRLVGEVRANDANTPISLMTTEIIDRRGTYRFITGDGTTNALAMINPGVSAGADDSAAMNRFGRSLVERLQDRRVIVAPTVPWVGTRFNIGDEIEQVRGRGVSLVTRRDGVLNGPVVIGKRIRVGDGRYETELTLMHDDGGMV